MYEILLGLGMICAFLGMFVGIFGGLVAFFHEFGLSIAKTGLFMYFFGMFSIMSSFVVEVVKHIG